MRKGHREGGPGGNALLPRLTKVHAGDGLPKVEDDVALHHHVGLQLHHQCPDKRIVEQLEQRHRLNEPTETKTSNGIRSEQEEEQKKINSGFKLFEQNGWQPRAPHTGWQVSEPVTATPLPALTHCISAFPF